ncbi:MAG TPA: hypothetical protein DCF49_02740 [Lachnospiraceae bacterium]|nr:hypothetical protein [Lachnospiraceae bacterium]
MQGGTADSVGHYNLMGGWNPDLMNLFVLDRNLLSVRDFFVRSNEPCVDNMTEGIGSLLTDA